MVNQKTRTQRLSDADLATLVAHFGAGEGAVKLVVVGMVYDMQRQIARAFASYAPAPASLNDRTHPTAPFYNAKKCGAGSLSRVHV